ncbi:MAG: cation:proton antiporter [Ignavibacteria bacterium]|jgi:CPA2 family monovalent cation:H+ antiporter-2|nr:cation:proton antiporter [Ignavibacteria bacterium]
MGHLPPLVNDLALILIVAGIVTLLFKWLRQPVVLGYIVAGFLISPHFIVLPSIIDAGNISVWADIGVIFLLFALGLEFSFKKLLANGSTVMIATSITMGCMIFVGYFIGVAMGWTQMECIFLGGMLSMSSTMIIIKAFDDMGLKKHKFAGIVFGMLIVEDLAAILMMVLLSTIAVGRDFEGMELVEQVLKLIFFVLIWFVIGIYLIPTLLNKVKKLLSDETLMIVSVGLCLGMVLFANAVGFSAALGAFIMGSILAETVQHKKIEHLIEPLKNLFGAVFFVSVGMLIVPDVIVEHWIPIVIITAVVMVGNVIFATGGIVASGESLKVAVYSGFSLAQIGEFSFIIATLGMQLGVISDFMYPIIVTVSVITTFTTPFFIKTAGPAYNFLEKKIPPKWNKIIVGYGNSEFKQIGVESEWKKYVNSMLTSITIYSAVTIAILIVARNFLYPIITEEFAGILGLVTYSVITILAMSPFINAIMRAGSHSPSEIRQFLRGNTLSKHKLVLLLLSLLKTIISPLFIVIVLVPVFPDYIPLLVVISIVLAIIIVLIQGFRDQTQKMELHFKANLTDKEEDHKSVTLKVQDDLRKKSIHIERITVPQNSKTVGKTLAELNFRKYTGISIVSIIRGNAILNIPDRYTRIYPFDKIVIVGSDEEVQKFVEMLHTSAKINNEHDDEVASYRVEVYQYVIAENSPLIHHTIVEMNIQKKTACLITGIERKGEMITKFNASFVFEMNDILWLAGEKQKLEHFEAALLLEGTKTYRY